MGECRFKPERQSRGVTHATVDVIGKAGNDPWQTHTGFGRHGMAGCVR